MPKRFPPAQTCGSFTAPLLLTIRVRQITYEVTRNHRMNRQNVFAVKLSAWESNRFDCLIQVRRSTPRSTALARLACDSPSGVGDPGGNHARQ